MSGHKNRCHILKTACLNVSALTTGTKQTAIKKWAKDECLDVIGISETCFKDSREPQGWIPGYRCFYNSYCANELDPNSKYVHKWGVALIIRENIKVCNIVRASGALTGRVVMVATSMEAKCPKILWLICAYAPVRTFEHEVFFKELNKVWDNTIKNKDQVIFMGDLNAHLTGTHLERSAPNALYDKESTAFREFVLKRELLDARGLLGALLIRRDFTYTHHDGSVARLDYHLTTMMESVLTFQTIDFNRVATNHRAIIVETDLFRLTGGWKTIMKPHQYPIPINVVNSTEEQLKEFAGIEERWLAKINKKLYVALVNNHRDTDDLVLRKQNQFLEDLARLCSKKARSVWDSSLKFTHKVSKDKGVLEGKITSLRLHGSGERTKGLRNSSISQQKRPTPGEPKA